MSQEQEFSSPQSKDGRLQKIQTIWTPWMHPYEHTCLRHHKLHALHTHMFTALLIHSMVGFSDTRR